MLDLVVRGGTVIDGTGAAARSADVGVRDARIVYVGPRAPAAQVEIDANGAAVAPGFVDVHTHSDAVPFLPDADPFKVVQGVTTEVFGNCGVSHGGATDHGLRERGWVDPFAGRPWAERFDRYLDAVDQAGVVLNTATLVGHGTLRTAVGAVDPTVTAEQRTAMGALLERALAAGAVGLSTGLEYAPGSFSDPDEIEFLARIVQRHGAIYTTHMRNESDFVEQALAEALDIARRTGVRLHVSHLKASGPAVHGSAPALLRAIDEARGDGIDVTCDMYPYTACSAPLSALLPQRALEGGLAALVHRLGDAGERRRLHAESTAAVASDGIGFWREVTPDGVRIVAHENPDLVGKTLAEILAGRSAWEALCDVVAADPGGFGVYETMAERDVTALLRHPAPMIASDSVLPARTGHPRTWGCFPYLLGTWVRDRGVLSLEDAVRRATHAPAERFGLHERGLIAPHAFADLVVFDPASINHDPDPLRASDRPAGVSTVIVNGQTVVRDGVPSGSRAGRVLRR